MLDDNKKIGMGLLGLSFLFISMGVLFLLDSTLIAIGKWERKEGGREGTEGMGELRHRANIRTSVLLVVAVFLCVGEKGVCGSHKERREGGKEEGGLGGSM